MFNCISSRACRLRLLFAPALLLTGAVAHGQAVNVTAANASNDAIYSVTFSGSSGSITVLNTDGGSLHHLTSLVFLTNTNPASYQLDLLAADNQGGLIVRYPGDFHAGPGPSTPVFQYPEGPQGGPAYPDGLSVDAQWDLFVVNSKPGSSSNPQLWVLPTAGGGNFTTPQLLDSNYGSSEVLEETLVVGTTIIPQGGAVITGSVASGVLTVTAGTVVVGALITGTGVPDHTVVSSQLGPGTYQLSNSFSVASETLTQPVLEPGDLLVLTSNPSYVLRYAGANGNGPLSGPVIPTILITLPAGATPGGMAFLPDNSLLISDSRGTITQYQFTPGGGTTSTTWAQGLGNGQFKIKTGVQSGITYAYVANNNGGDILEFGAGGGSPIATVTSGVQHPQGLAVTNTNYTSITNCESNLCDILLGGQNGNPGLIRHNATGLSAAGNVLEKLCVVQLDPRLVSSANCTTSLPVSTICPGFADNVVVPASLCGASGPTGKGFALVQTLTQAYVQPGFPFNGATVFSDTNLQAVLPSGSDPVCNPAKAGKGPSPLGTIAWAPLANEGIEVEGNNILELTSGCDGNTAGTKGLSLFGLGFALNVPDLVAFTNTKYTNLGLTFTNGSNNGELDEGVLAPKSLPTELSDGNITYQILQCIATSQQAFQLGNSAYYDGAAQDLLTADETIGAHATDPMVFPNANSDYPNPSGELRQRLQNMYYTIETRINLQLASATPPTTSSPTAPTIGGTPITKIQAGNLYQFQALGHDFAHTFATQPPAPNNLTYSIAAPAPFLAWATLNPTTGLLSGTAVKGTYNGIVITLTDGCASSTLSFNLKVN